MEELLDSFAVPDLSPRPRTIPENQDVVAEEDEAVAVEDDDPDVDAAAVAAAEEEESERDIFGQRLCVSFRFRFRDNENFQRLDYTRRHARGWTKSSEDMSDF